MLSRSVFNRLAIDLGKLSLAVLVVSQCPAPTIAAPLSTQDIDAVASQTTVLIARNLKKGDVEARKEWNPGSGVLIARQGNTYYAVTNTHVVKLPIQNGLWGIRTWDGEVHKVTDASDTIIRFADNYNPITNTMDGYDLAVLKFQSENDYPVASMGNPANLTTGESVFISGWPRPADDAPQRKRVFRTGTIAKVDMPVPQGGYNILYSNDTFPGMSGSPVFNNEARLVGFHAAGRAKGTVFCVDPELSKNNSCGIQGNHFIREAQRKRLPFYNSFNHCPVDQRLVAWGQKNKNTADFIFDIYGLFTELEKIKLRIDSLESRLDRLSGGFGMKPKPALSKKQGQGWDYSSKSCPPPPEISGLDAVHNPSPANHEQIPNQSPSSGTFVPATPVYIDEPEDDFF